MKTTASNPENPTFTFEIGKLSLEQIRGILDALPLDLNFVDEEDLIAYYNVPKGREWKRQTEVIGRPVQDCHPAESVPFVNEVLEDLKTGRKDMVQTVGSKDGRPVRRRYIAAHSQDGRYLGCVCIAEFLDFGEEPG